MARPATAADILALRVQHRTHETYEIALRQFNVWLDNDAKSSFPFLQLSPTHLDSLLVDYFTFLFNQPKPQFSRAKSTFFGILFFAPHFRFGLSYSHGLLKSWKKSQVPPQKAPIPWHLALVFARVCSEYGMFAEGLAFLIMHHTYLRVNNVLKLKKSDVIADLREADPDFPLMILRILKTKTDPFKYVEIRRQDLADVIAAYTERFSNQSDLLFQFSYSHLRNVLKLLCRNLNLTQYGFTLHKFRHGGASHDHLKGVDFTTIKRRGIWKLDSSVENYVSTGVCFSILTSLPPVFLRVAKILNTDVATCFLMDEKIL